jgi:hypothetical protein
MSVWVSHTADALGDFSRCRGNFFAWDFIGLFEDVHIDVEMEKLFVENNSVLTVYSFSIFA